MKATKQEQGLSKKAPLKSCFVKKYSTYPLKIYYFEEEDTYL